MYTVRNWLAMGTHAETQRPDILKNNEIGAVLLLANPVQQPTIPSLYLPIHGGNPIYRDRIQQGVEFVQEHRNLGHRILIACDTGLTCSPPMAMVILKETVGMTLINAYRAMIDINPNIRLHPIVWESLCNNYSDEPSYDVLWFQINMLTQQYQS